MNVPISIVVILSLAFGFLNGFHDSANITPKSGSSMLWVGHVWTATTPTK